MRILFSIQDNMAIYNSIDTIYNVQNVSSITFNENFHYLKVAETQLHCM